MHLIYQIQLDNVIKEILINVQNNVLVRDFRNGSNKVKWTPGVLIDPQGSRIWTIKVENHIWRRHENQILPRQWSTDEDIISNDSASTAINTDRPTATTTDHKSCSLTSTSSSDEASQVLRRSPRLRKPVRRLIEEI
jgi:hypothetical protein